MLLRVDGAVDGVLAFDSFLDCQASLVVQQCLFVVSFVQVNISDVVESRCAMASLPLTLSSIVKHLW
jgi:hypothetical protein